MKREAPAASAEQSSFFDPRPCGACGRPMEPHFLPNYTPPVWVAAHGPKCGDPLYAPSRESLAVDWNAARACECGRTFPAPYWSDREKCDTCLFPTPSHKGQP
jgi:hypothetical protein